nr:hypothetical protein [Tanacetum cinerariifolium]
MTLALMAKAFTLNNTTPTNNNQRSSSNPSNMQIAQPGMNMDQDRQMLMVEDNVGNQFIPNAVQNLENQYGNRNVVTASAEGNGNGINDAYEETKRVKPNCILKDNLQQASTSDGSTEYTELLEPILEPHQVPYNDSNVIYEVSSVDQGGRIVEQHFANVEETRAYHESLCHNLAVEVGKVNSVNHKMKETNAELTTELARYKNQEKCFEIS